MTATNKPVGHKPSNQPPKGRPSGVVNTFSGGAPENAIDARAELGIGSNPREFDAGGTANVVRLDGSLDHENAFKDAGSDANARRGSKQGKSLPPWVA
jgi:hypothetical protein